MISADPSLMWNHSVFDSLMGIVALASVATAFYVIQKTRAQQRIGSVDLAAEQFRVFFELSGFGAAMVDPVSFRFLQVNSSLCTMLGYTEEELKGKTFLEITVPEDRLRNETEYKEIKKSGSLHWHSEKRYLRKDGNQIWVSIHGTLVQDKQQRTLHSLATIQDITQQKLAEAALKESEERFKALAHSIPQLAWSTDATGFINWYNQRWYDYTGTTLEEMRTQGWIMVHHPDHTERVTKKWLESLKTGDFWEDTFPLRAKNGTYRWFLSRAIPVKDEEGHILHWYGTNTDVTEHLQIERELKESKELAEKASAAKTQFLANMSHEIRTPIGAIMGFTGLLRNSNNTEEERTAFMDIVERNSLQLLRLIDEILDLSKIEAGKIVIDYTEFPLTVLLNDITSMMHLKASEKSIEFKLKLQSEIPDIICTDLTRLKQILTNIVGNAIKFTESGSVELAVKFEDPFLMFNVTDTGRGISEEQRTRLFRPFEQADPSMTRKYGGTGLGLILAKRLSEALGGSLELGPSQLGQGSQFFIKIKPTLMPSSRFVGPDALNLADSLGRPSLLEPAVLQDMKILVVEDSPDNQVLIKTYLRKTGAVVSFASDGSVGVKKAQQENPDLILMDIQMPVMDGHQAMQTLRAEGYAKPIIALTAHAMREEKERCFDSGCNEFMTKPVNRHVLIDMLSKYHHNQNEMNL